MGVLVRIHLPGHQQPAGQPGAMRSRMAPMNARNLEISMQARRSPLVALFSALWLLAGHAGPAAAAEAIPTDNRVLLTIPFEDREDLLRVMRGNLNQVKQMLEALAENDFAGVEKVANEMTFNKKKGDGLAIRGNAAYTAMGVQFHAVRTVELRDAARAKDGKRVVRALSSTLDTCTSCHATFKLTEWPDNKTYARPAPIPLDLPAGAKVRD